MTGTRKNVCRIRFHSLHPASFLAFFILALQVSITSPLDPGRIQVENKENKTKLLFFTVVWCRPCKKVKEVLDELPKEYKDLFELITIDYDQSPEEVHHYQVEESRQFFFLTLKTGCSSVLTGRRKNPDLILQAPVLVPRSILPVR